MWMNWDLLPDKSDLRGVEGILGSELEVEKELLPGVDAVPMWLQLHLPLVKLIGDLHKLQIQILTIFHFFYLILQPLGKSVVLTHASQSYFPQYLNQ